MTIAVDFDGTIVEHRYPEIGKEIPFAIETLKKLQEDRHRLILWTAREGELLDAAVEYCRRRGLEFYAVNADEPDAKWEGYTGSRKLRCDLFIDDRNVGGLPDWMTIYELISRHISFGDLLEKASSGFEDVDEEEEDGFWARFRDAISGRSRRHGRRSSHHW